MDTKLDMLITRVVDGVAAPADWDALEALGAADPSIWRELAQAQRTEQLLKAAATEAVAGVEFVELPSIVGTIGEAGLKSRMQRVGSWGGWAAAALVTLAFVGRGTYGQSGQGQAGPATQGASLVPSFPSAEELRQKYIDQGKKEGRVVAEMPDRVLLDATPTEDGKAYEVVFVRQIMERARVKSLWQMSHDEEGKVVPSRVELVVSSSGNRPPF